MRSRAYAAPLYLLLLGLATFAMTEFGFRVYLAMQIGPRLLLYGTPWHRNDMQATLDGEAVATHRNDRGHYTKYFPHERKTLRDELTDELYEVRINNHGFRGKDFSLEKPPGTIRVITLGASSTFGYSNPDPHTYPRLLETMLNRNTQGRARFEVINFGIPHATTDEIVALFLAEGVDLEPDFVTLYAGANDSGYMYLAHSSGGVWDEDRPQLLATPEMLQHRFVVSEFLAHLLRQLRRASDTYSGEGIALEASRTFLGNAARLRVECAKREIHFIVANQQAKSFWVDLERRRGLRYREEEALLRRALDIEKREATPAANIFLIHAHVMRDLEKWVSEQEVDFVDVIEALDRHRHLLVSWVHLHPEGNRRVAEALGKRVLERAFLPKPLEEASLPRTGDVEML